MVALTIVLLYAPMKRGLKLVAPFFQKIEIKVLLYAPMKRGLKPVPVALPMSITNEFYSMPR